MPTNARITALFGYFAIPSFCGKPKLGASVQQKREGKDIEGAVDETNSPSVTVVPWWSQGPTASTILGDYFWNKRTWSSFENETL